MTTMRSLSFASLLLALTLPVLATPASAQSKRHTVLDYYKILPERFFEISAHPTSVKARLEWLREGFAPYVPADNRSVVDIQHDFMRVPCDGAQSGLDIAIFRFHGQETVAVREHYDGWDHTPSFWRLRHGHLMEVTKHILPRYFVDALPDVITLPRYGTTIEALESGNHFKPLRQTPVKFFWRGGQFIRG